MDDADVEGRDRQVIEAMERSLRKTVEQRYRYRLGGGTALTDGQRHVRLMGFERHDGAGLNVLIEVDGLLQRTPFAQLCANTPALASLNSNGDADDGPPDDPQWEALDAQSQAGALQMARHLRQVMTGSPDGNLDRAIALGRCDDRYDPRLVPELSQRIRHKSAELAAMGERGVAFSSLERKIQLFGASGVMGLVDKRSLRSLDPLEGLDPDVASVIGDVVATRIAKSQLSNRNMMTVVRAELRSQGLGGSISDRQLKIVLRELTRGRALHRPIRSRKTHSNRPGGVLRRIQPSRPGEIVQIDATPANAHVWFPDLGWGAATILTAIDAYIRQILALRVVAEAVTTRDTALLVWDMCQGQVRQSGWPRELRRWHGIPHLVVIDSEQTQLPNEGTDVIGTKPAVMPSAIVIDHGREFDAEHFLSVCARNGIDVIFARPNVATDKGIVESWHNAVDQALRLMPGYKGPNPQDHPAGAEADAALTRADMQDMLWTWILTIYHDRPHEGLRDPANPRIHVSPNIAFDRFIEVGGYIEVPTDPYRLISFLSCKPDATVQQDGIRINHHRYNDERVVKLRSRMQSGVRSKTRRIPVYYDRWDMSRVYLLHPFDREWLCIPLATPGGTAVAPFSEAITRAAISDTIHGDRPAGVDEIARREVELLAAFSSGVFADRRERRLRALEESRQTALASEIEGWSHEMRELAFPPQPEPDEGLDGYDGAELDDAGVFAYDEDDVEGLAL